MEEGELVLHGKLGLLYVFFHILCASGYFFRAAAHCRQTSARLKSACYLFTALLIS
jgi:hypothetical protein